VNLCLQEDLFRKRARWTQSSDQITFIRDETDLGRLWKHLEDNTPRPDPRADRVGLADPTCRMTHLRAPPISPSSLHRFPTAFEVQSTPLLKVGLIRRLRFDVAMDSWAHRTPGSPIYSPPYPLLRHLHHQSRTTIIIQEDQLEKY
jgi:hypothetical protein